MNENPMRRRFLRNGAVLAAIPCGLSWLDAFGQTSTADQIHDLRGDVRLNGRAYERGTPIRVGDTVSTGSNGWIVFTMGRDALFLRSRSELRLEGDARSFVVDALRLLTGALGAVFETGRRRTVFAPTVTAGIRGTGLYTETRGTGTSFCTCYGTVELEAGASRELIVSTRHSSPRWVPAVPSATTPFEPAQLETHTDAEMDMLEKCVGRRVPWATR